MKKSCIVVDVDGVILDFAGPFSQWWNKNHETKIEKNPSVWVFNQNITIAELHAGVDAFMGTHPILPLCATDIPLVLKRIRKTHKVHIITAAHEMWKKDRVANLEHVGVEYDSLQFSNYTCKKDMIDKLNPFLVIEDSPDTVRKLTAHGYPCFVPSALNYTQSLQSVEGVTMYEDWTKIESFCYDQ